MEFYWLTTEEYTYGFFSTFEKAVKCAEDDYDDHVGAEKAEFKQSMRNAKTWGWAGYYIHHITELDVKLF